MEDKDIIKDFGKVNVPVKWSDITLEKYQKIDKYYSDKEKKFNILDVLDILIDKDRDYIASLPSEFLDAILEKLSFLSTAPEVGEASNKIEINGEEYKINIMEKLKLGEYVAVDTVIKNDSSDYSSILAIICRKDGEIYDSKFEAEIFEDRKKMFERQPITKIMPIVGFFLSLYTTSKIPSLLYMQVEEGINLTQQNIDNSQKIGASKKLYLNWQMRKLRKSLKSIKRI